MAAQLGSKDPSTDHTIMQRQMSHDSVESQRSLIVYICGRVGVSSQLRLQKVKQKDRRKITLVYTQRDLNSKYVARYEKYNQQWT